MSQSGVQTRLSQDREMADADLRTATGKLDTFGVHQQLGLLRKSLTDSTAEQEKRPACERAWTANCRCNGRHCGARPASRQSSSTALRREGSLSPDVGRGNEEPDER